MDKPKTRDGINFKLTGLTLKVLGVDDVILPGDFIRPYYESPMYSQDGGWDTTYKDDRWCGPMWHRVEDDFGAWVGRTYREYYKYAQLDEIVDEIVRVIDQ